MAAGQEQCADIEGPLGAEVDALIEQRGPHLGRGHVDEPVAVQHVEDRLLLLGAQGTRLPPLAVRGRRRPLGWRADLTARLGLTPESPALLPSANATNLRVFSGDQFRLVPPTDLSGMHVMILDDTLTTGSRTQSAALALRRYGARYVTVMVISRYLRPRVGNNAEFTTARLRRDYSPDICPVTGGDCP